MLQQVNFPSGTVNFYFDGEFNALWGICDKEKVVIITNDHLAAIYAGYFKKCTVVVIQHGESNKTIATITTLTKELLQVEATRKTTIIGVGGGVITDIVGFLASVYMRGVDFGFVPTTLLAMVDAAIGGKNGVNVGLYKNIIGLIAQPKFILFDTHFLQTLPDTEWSNGFAEIIKYACIFDAPLLDELEQHSISYYKQNTVALNKLIERCAGWKNKTVIADEKETGIRKLLNFGHTAAHAIENLYELPHGKAVAVGMVIACMIAEQQTGLPGAVTKRLKKILQQYHLPISIKLDARKAMQILSMDKKRHDNQIDYILLNNIGDAVIMPLALNTIENALIAYESNN